LGTYVLRRFFTLILVWVGVTILVFIIANVVPSDPVAFKLGPKASPESIAYWRHQYGLDQPLPQQYIRFMNGLFHGDLGTSIWSGRPIRSDLTDYLPGTLELAITALFLAIGVGIPLGIWAGRNPGGVVDRGVLVFASFGLALPLFWLALVFQGFFYRDLGWLPLNSRINLVLGPPPHVTGFYLVDSLLAGDLQRFGDSLRHLAMPAVVLSLPTIGAVARMTRASILEAMTQDYVRTARAKGVPQRLLLWKHVLSNALLPVVTLLGNAFNGLLAGVFVVEVVFDWPGLGWYATRVILASDYGSVVSITLVIAIMATTVNLGVDILYHRLDPRIQMT
jgi:peptide/nickel transport system permease protein